MAQLTEVGSAQSLADATITTTTELVAVTSDPIYVPGANARIVIIARAVVTLGTGTTAVTPRVRRGTTIADTLVGEANAEQIKTAAGSSEPFDALVADEVSGVDQVTYVFTVQQTGASGNGTVVSASILVLEL